MDFEQALEFLNCALVNKIERPLTQVEIALVYGAWENLTYDRIADRSGYTVNYLQRDIGPKFWKLLSEALDHKVNKTTLRAILINLENPLPHRLPEVKGAIDWGEAPDVKAFQGRQAEIDQLTHCIAQERCRLVAIVGQGGIGKSSLAAKVARQVAGEFDFVTWRSLRNAPSLGTLLGELVPFVSGQKDIQARPERLLHWLQTHRCLVILDNQETLLQPGKEGGHYQPQFANYADLFQMLGEASHQSCILLTSRERSTKVGLLEDSQGAVRLLALKGSWEASLAVIEAKRLVGTENEKRRLGELYRCNPLALKMVATSIKNLFEGEITAFFESETPIFNGIRRLLDQQFERLSPLEQTIMYWLAINREWTAISTLQSDILPTITRASLLEALESLTGRSLVEKQVRPDKGRAAGQYTQQPVIMEYITDRFIQRVVTELVKGEIACLNHYALTKTTVLDYIRESQIRVLLTPMIERLQDAFHHDIERLEQHLQTILSALYSPPIQVGSYGAGNLINLCLHLGIDLTGSDFSHLTIRHADLQEATLQRVNFQAAYFMESTFTQTFTGGVGLAVSPNGQRFAFGDTNAGLHIWQFEPMQPQITVRGKYGWVIALAWHPDGTTLAYCVEQTVKLLDAATGSWLRNYQGHTPWVLALAWSPDGTQLACAGQDSFITVWDGNTGTSLASLEVIAPNYELQWIFSLAWLADGTLLAGACIDHTIKIWDVASGDCIQELQSHTDWVASLALHPDGSILASSGYDRAVKLWDWQTGACLQTIATLDLIYQLEWSADGNVLAGGSFNHTITVWDGGLQCLQMLQGHQSWVRGLAWRPDGKSLVSVAYDQVLKLWDAQTGDCVKTLRGYSNSSWCIRWSKDGIRLISGSTNHAVQLCDSQTGDLIRAFRGHYNEVLSVDWSPDEHQVASSSADATIRIWDVQTGQCLRVFEGHIGWVRTVAWSPDGKTVISGSDDHTIKLWDAHSGQCLLTLADHSHQVPSVVWCPAGHRVASGSMDETIRFWDISQGVCDRVIHVNHPIHAIAFSPDGKTLISGDYQDTVKLWDVESGDCLKGIADSRNESIAERPEISFTISQNHTAIQQRRFKTFQEVASDQVYAVAWNADGTKVASACDDSTVRIWDVSTGECEHIIQGNSHGMAVDWHPCKDLLAVAFLEQPIQLWDGQTQQIVKTLRCDRPYEGMNITGATGISEAQKANLKLLGAIDA